MEEEYDNELGMRWVVASVMGFSFVLFTAGYQQHKQKGAALLLMNHKRASTNSNPVV